MSAGRAPWEGYRAQHVPLGGYGIASDPGVVITTLLGSCVSACLFDAEAGVGGLNHFLLPEGEASLLYGTHAMERLIDGLLGRGARRGHVRAKAFGGGRMKGAASVLDVGRRNAEFARAYLASEGFALVAEDLGGGHARRVRMHAATGRVWIERVQDREAAPLAFEEGRFARDAGRADVAGGTGPFG